MKIQDKWNAGWAIPMVMGMAAAGTIFAFAASHSLAEDSTETKAPAKARCVSTPIETSDIIDRRTLYIEDRSGNAAILTMGSGCLQQGEAVGFEFYGASQICRPIDANITGSITSVVPVRCLVKSVKLLTREEARAYRTR